MTKEKILLEIAKLVIKAMSIIQPIYVKKLFTILAKQKFHHRSVWKMRLRQDEE